MTEFDFEPMAEDPYERLDIPRDAPPDLIREARMKAKMRYDPDAHRGDKKDWARKRFFRMQEAIEAVEDGHRGGTDGKRSGGTRTSGGGPSDGGTGTESGDDTRTESGDDTRTVHLELEPARTRSTVGETVRFRVKGDDGYVDGAEVSVPGVGSDVTGPGTPARITFDEAGSFRATANKSGADATYISDSCSIEVSKRTVELEIDLETDTTTTAEPIDVVVTDGSERVSGVEISTSRGETFYLADGSGSLDFDEPGHFDLAAEKEDTADRTFEPAVRKGIEVEVAEVNLQLEPTAHECELGDELVFTVRNDGGDRIAGVDVHLSSGAESDETDRRGTCRLRMSEPGTVTVEAEKEREGGVLYRGTEVDVTVREPTEDTESTGRDSDDRGDARSTGRDSDDRRDARSTGRDPDDRGDDDSGDVSWIDEDDDEETADLEIERGAFEVEEGGSIEFTVTDSDGEPVEEARVQVDETGHIKTTGEGGKCTFTFEKVGRKTLSATKGDGDGQLRSRKTIVTIRHSGPDPPPPEPETPKWEEWLTRGGPLVSRALLLVAVVLLMSSFVAPGALGVSGLMGTVLLVVLSGGILVVAFVLLKRSG